MEYNYETIKAIAKTIGRKVTDLIALAPQNDPFYCGTDGDLSKAAWFRDIWERAGFRAGTHLRRIHYWIVSQSPTVNKPDGTPYLNTENDWSFLLNASKQARYLGFVSIADIADHKSPPPTLTTDYGFTGSYDINLPDFENLRATVYRQSYNAAQPYHLEVWCEKSTMNDVLEPVCRQYHANLCTFEGEVSLTACYELMQRVKIAGKPARIWYISDFDPAGNNMPAAMSRKIEFLARSNGKPLDIRVTPVALTLEQVRQYQLPRTPIKATEKRATSFENAFGAGATELDALEALHPGELARILSAVMRLYFSTAADNAVKEQARRLQSDIDTRLNAITGRYQDELAALKTMFEELRAIQIDTTEYAVNQYAPTVSENGDWLLDTHRDYMTQLDFYNRHKGKQDD
jgi:hypothetical protein